MVVTIPADLAHEDEVLGIGVQRGVDQLVRDVGPVVLGGVDVVDAQLDGPAQDGERRLPVAWWTPDARTGELHRAEADAGHRAPGQHRRAAGRVDSQLGRGHLLTPGIVSERTVCQLWAARRAPVTGSEGERTCAGGCRRGRLSAIRTSAAGRRGCVRAPVDVLSTAAVGVRGAAATR